MTERTAQTSRGFRSRYRVGPGALEELGRCLDLTAPRIPILADTQVWALYGDDVTAALAPSAPLVFNMEGEGEKGLETIERLVTGLAHHRVHRRETLLVLGGGVCCDTGGLLSMLYMRGIPYVIVATTLMAQLDAAIGGKVGANAAERKNLLGGFYHPETVLIDPTFLETLPSRHLRAALAEAVKLHVLLPGLGIQPLLGPALAGDERALTRLAERCLDGKLALLEGDPFETDLRRELNLGHAVAHALEAMPGCKLLHGEAVAVGLAATARYAELEGICDAAFAADIVAQLEELELPVEATQDSDDVLAYLEKIADHRGGSIHLVVPAGDESTEIIENCDFGLLAECTQGSRVTH